MADRDTTITIDGLHDAIKAKFSEWLPGFEVECYPDDRETIPTPALHFELAEFDKSPDAFDPGTGQEAVLARFEARLIISFRTASAKVAIRRLVASFVAKLRGQRFGLPIGPAKLIGAYPDDFNPVVDQFEIWRVEWTNIVHLGDGPIDTGGATEMLFSWEPYVGQAWKHAYKPIHEMLMPGEIPPAPETSDE